ncbi:TIGR03364 family FAD-dependent oxidoreductase [Parapedobacter koreensis]|uniref:FAD dependent oxidoreductase TIGR03364 n=1 Tax=Parapedobacter koreensis TaxID=332977 RepID=A0A1H7FWI6_9SPHI|nr:TIGR03364 family FAD-dependent oxidoreductase [Parapedobacter koreensis]SEK28842.1 FAD dependent oxidoreductase TIGR03364 [Parapedobacter koreensis]
MNIGTQKNAAVIGAGIVGLATAKVLSEKGYRVTVYERHAKAVGASVRNFGMVWPVGQPAGDAYQWAIRSRDTWKTIGAKAGIWHEQVGSLHLAYRETELAVMEDYVALYGNERDCAMLTPEQVAQQSTAAHLTGLKGALWSAEELIVDPREAIAKIAAYLEEQRGVVFKWNTAVSRIVESAVYTAAGDIQRADLIVVCSGADFETLYPELYAASPVTKCKLQMMRLVAQPGNWRIGPSLCGGLSLLHYGSFQAASSISVFREWAEREMPEYLKWGIHVMVSQQGNGELTIGDSHEYGLCPDPFDRQVINTLILNYLSHFTQFKDYQLLESWNGVYAKMTNGSNHLLLRPEENLIILNALGGAGMTLSFGLAEHVFN